MGFLRKAVNPLIPFGHDVFANLREYVLKRGLKIERDK